MDIEGLRQSLNARSVRYVVIGATAFPVHGYARSTLDLDLFIEPTPSNAARTREALAAFGDDMSDVSIDELLSKKILIRKDTLETDLHPFVKGVTFEQVWEGRIEDRPLPALPTERRSGDRSLSPSAAQAPSFKPSLIASET